MDCLLGYSKSALSDVLRPLGLPSFRIGQIYKWLQNGVDFSGMSDIPLPLRTELSQKFAAQPVSTLKRLDSSDGSAKFLYALSDSNVIEGVYMPHAYGDTLCVSTQVGCRMGCSFCASGIGGLVRNLTAAEMLGQVAIVNRLSGGTTAKRALTNLVLMGSGEPLDNYENVTDFFRLVTAPDGLNFSQRNVSLSTCGICENIVRLVDDGFSVTLSLSLHATTDESRRRLMPIANRYTLKEVMDAVRYYFKKTGRRIIFEYAMVKGQNMDYFDAKRLSELGRGFGYHVNLIRLNYVKEKALSGCTEAEADRFCERLNDMGVSATVRRSFGNDIGGACGQLRRSFLQEKRSGKEKE